MANGQTQELKTIKIPQNEWEKLEEVRKLLAINGIHSLRDQIRKDAEQQLNASKNLTWGVIIGIGATLLIQELSN